jgi:hypothetical protein
MSIRSVLPGGWAAVVASLDGVVRESEHRYRIVTSLMTFLAKTRSIV